MDVFQQVGTLSFISNLPSDWKGTQESIQLQFQETLTTRLPTVGSGWQLVWGPVVWKHDPTKTTTGPDNSWYVAYHPSLMFEDGSVHPTYVVAIAGTPPESAYVWAKEDFAVNAVADFKAWVAGGIQNKPVILHLKDIVRGVPYIAKGTVNTVHKLLVVPTPYNAVSPDTTLIQFLSNLDKSASPRIITTGHSLGGALSPSLALALTSAGIIPVNDTLTYPSAGPSPGNIFFTDLFASKFPARKAAGSRSYQGWNLNLVNTLDIVPQAWCVFQSVSKVQNLGNIPPIFGLPIISLVKGTSLLASVQALRSGVRYKPIPSQYFTGTPPPTVPATLSDFIKIARQEHVDAYVREFGPGSLTEVGQPKSLGHGLEEKTRDEIRFNYPVIADLEWARENPEKAYEVIGTVEGTPEAQAFLEGNDRDLV